MKLVFLFFIGVLTACGPTRPDQWVHGPDGREHALMGKASWYGERFDGRSTASGEIFDSRLLTAAHRTLPFQTVVRVTELESRKSVVVKINDRGPYTEGRVIDLAKGAAEELGMIRAGVVEVRVEILSWPDQ